jgi:hypothetical protein
MNEELSPHELEAQKFELEQKLHLKAQWEAQVRSLNETGILELLPELMDIGVRGIDGKGYPVPKYEEILARLTPEKLELISKKVEQGFTKLLLVPMAASIDVLIDRYRQEILTKHEAGKLLSTDGTQLDLDKETPVWVWDEYKKADADGRLVYYPKEFSQNHQGKTKQDLINEGDGWEIRLIEYLPDLPAQGMGQKVNEERGLQTDRIPLEANHTPREYLQTTQTDPIYQAEDGLTPEGWLTYATTHLHETDKQIDDYQGKGKLCYLFGSYFPAGSDVPRGCWGRGTRRAYLLGGGPDRGDSGNGARPSVKI